MERTLARAVTLPQTHIGESRWGGRGGGAAITMSGAARRTRPPLQKGRYLSTEAIQTVQALKRAHSTDPLSLGQVLRARFSRLLKLDMMAVLRELLRQNHCLLSLEVFESIREEDWYKPRVSLYAEMIGTMAANGCPEQAELLYRYLEAETKDLEAQAEGEGFGALLGTLIHHKLTALAMQCYALMGVVGCEPDRSTFRMLIHGFASLGESDAAAAVRLDARQCYPGFLEDEDDHQTQ